MGSYTQYNDKMIDKVPMFTLTAENPLDFLVDSGARFPVIRASEFPVPPKLSGHY